MQHSQRAAADSPDTGPWLAAFDELWPGLRRRAAGIALALLLEVGLLLLLLTLGRSAMGDREAADSLTTVDFAPEPPAPDAPPEPDEAAAPSALPRPQPQPQPDVPTPPVPPPPPPAAVIAPQTQPAPPPAAADGGLAVDPESGLCVRLPGWRVLVVPCAGWVHTMTLERVLRRGASQALVA